MGGLTEVAMTTLRRYAHFPVDAYLGGVLLEVSAELHQFLPGGIGLVLTLGNLRGLLVQGALDGARGMERNEDGVCSLIPKPHSRRKCRLRGLGTHECR